MGAPSAWAGQSVAEIDGAPVSSDDFLAYFKAYARSKLYHGGSKERLRELADEALENLITDRLLQREASRRGVAGDDAEVARRMAEIEKAYRDSDNWSEVESRLPVIEAEVRADTQIEALKTQITRVATPTEAALRRFHAENPDLFTQPPAYDLDLILVGVPPSALARDWKAADETAARIAALLRAGESFADLAAKHSTHQTASLGGKLGQVHRGQLPDEAQAEVDKLTPGGLTGPVRTLEGFAILRLNHRMPAVPQPFEDVRDRVEAIYLRDTSAAQWSGFLRGLRAAAKIETSDVAALVEKTLARE